jgi:hydroxyacylglutathione hydrolase
MAVEIFTIPCLHDNYAYIVHDNETNKNSLFDAPEAKSIIAFLKKKNWNLEFILITHHHSDHINGINELSNVFGCKIIGSQDDKKRLPPLDKEVAKGEILTIGSLELKILDVPGHTLGHIAYYCASEGIIFTGDSLMALGCGRLFEGSSTEMYKSLEEISYLPDETLIYSGHEYAFNNARFALSIEADNQHLKNRFELIKSNLQKQIPNVPVTLLEEKRTNPFLRAHVSEIKKSLNMTDKKNECVFAELRRLKDNF